MYVLTERCGNISCSTTLSRSSAFGAAVYLPRHAADWGPAAWLLSCWPWTFTFVPPEWLSGPDTLSCPILIVCGDCCIGYFSFGQNTDILPMHFYPWKTDGNPTTEELLRMTKFTNIWPCFVFSSEPTTNLHTGKVVNQVFYKLHASFFKGPFALSRDKQLESCHCWCSL